MVGSVNKVILIGNLGRDPEIRSTSSGGKVVQLSLATSDRWRDKATGDVQEKTEWHRVVVFDDKLADVCERYVKKGTKVYIEGQLQTRKWQDNTGQDRYTTEVVLGRFKSDLVILEPRGNEGSSLAGSYGEVEFNGGSHRTPGKAGAPATPTLDDDIPF